MYLASQLPEEYLGARLKAVYTYCSPSIYPDEGIRTTTVHNPFPNKRPISRVLGRLNSARRNDLNPTKGGSHMVIKIS